MTILFLSTLLACTPLAQQEDSMEQVRSENPTTLLSSDSKYFESQSGIGFLVGLGVKYEFHKFTLFINPNYQQHGVINFKRKTIKVDTRELKSKVINFGIGYKF